ncbi:hypothetical protein CXF62_10040 [Psychrobacter sp. MES7-P7E]|nr:hypothetical protein CXF62_10040 [Psychrobacter sp. MES7-P7E]|tara:strand:- start:1953 stop:3014 length:1062 start_codon:yes stop_codon:yes gene_type:complete
MNKNLQYTLMSFTGIFLMIIASGAFDSDPYYDEAYYDDTESNELYDIGEPGESQAGADAEVAVADAEADMQAADTSVIDEQNIEWVNELALIDEQYPNDMERLERYQSLIDNNNNPYAPILLANTIVNVKNQSRNVSIFEEWLDNFNFDIESLNSLDSLANSQNINAMFLLGTYYYQVQRYELSRNWLERAANQGHAGAMNQLAWIYREGLGVNEDLDYAVVWHRYSAEANYPRAMTNLAYLYSIGKGVEKDLETSARWYKRAAELNSASGIYAVAVYYLNGTGGMPKNEQEGVRLLMESAKLGHKRAMYAIGLRYEYGNGLEQNIDQAMDWYSESAKLGEPDAVAAMNRLNY